MGNKGLNQGVGAKTEFASRGDKVEVAVKLAAGCSRTCPRARDRRPNCSDVFFGRLKRRCNGGDTLTETTLQLP